MYGTIIAEVDAYAYTVSLTVSWIEVTHDRRVAVAGRIVWLEVSTHRVSVDEVSKSLATRGVSQRPGLGCILYGHVEATLNGSVRLARNDLGRVRVASLPGGRRCLANSEQA